ncbi:xanthine dehydrogenase family protein molybdopterin-binding subunit [Luteolibacter flavescens]|uniref:Xanthine dehydrogenase family protein molybdopterin-binding subunit n=1 Tax=Luteolibacter flavescens TaxID=1859460 RepID=A0ABT3FRS4_9BACT|nr:xanthine dehydrogenase family protein molybdopterin-binding subunit [Luteolibacter flavescens]MCW1886291.1 xanthine dehydrogenase family protein molybdopterin-binding subunit [Luteolibacter flavescens]
MIAPTSPAAPATLGRRRFLATSGGLVLGFFVPLPKRAAAAGTPPAKPGALPAPNAFLRIGIDGRVTVLLAHSEMGQGIWTTLPMLIAEELDADWSKVSAEHAPASHTYAHPAFGMQMTGGSTTTHSEFDRYRQVGALAKEMLVQAAAARFGVKPEECRTENGHVIAGEKRASYGELAQGAARVAVPKEAKLKDPKDWKIIGKATKRLDAPEKVNGSAQFGIDVHFDGLLTAVVARPPGFGGSVKSYDATAARKVPGVRDVVQVPSGVAVLADHFWAAKQGRDALEIEWKEGPAHDSAELLEEFRKLAGTEGAVAAKAGELPVAKGGKTIEADYYVPYLAHATMEPLNATAHLTEGKCEIWTGTQFQTMDQQLAAKAAGLEPGQVEIHTTFLGGGFGRRANPASDFIVEAVHVAKAAKKPVKVVWTREDDTRGGFYRPAFLHRASITLDDSGMPVGWKHVIVGQSIIAGTPMEAMMVKDGVDATSVEGVADSPYLKSVPNHRVDLHSPRPGIPVLWWRSVGHSHTGYAMECLIDEAANAAGKDPVNYRRMMLKDHPRHMAALNLAAEKSGWGKPLPAGHFHGVAVHESFGSTVAEVAEVSVSQQGVVKVHKITCAIDCGLAVNPEGVKAQMESGIVFALGAVLHSEITFEKGHVKQGNFHDYQVARMHESPLIETHIVPSTQKMGGAGECGVPPLAAAVCNAIHAATGKRVRELPIRNLS